MGRGCAPSQDFLKIFYAEIMHFMQNYHLIITCIQAIGVRLPPRPSKDAERGTPREIVILPLLITLLA